MPSSKRPGLLKSDFALSAIAGIISAVVLSIGIFALPSLPNPIGGEDEIRRNQAQQFSSINSDISILKSGLAEMSKKIEALSQLPDDAKMASQLNSLDISMSDLRTRFTEIERIIIADPAKAIELPLMRKDLDSIREVNQSQVTGLRQDIERAYTLIIGTIIALALAVLAIAVTNIFSKGKSAE